MAIYHMSIKIGSKSKGQSAIAAAAYRSGEKLIDAETGLTSDYTRKTGVVFSEISLCDNAPAEYADRAALWNAVHQVENNKNAQLWREFEAALPHELNREEQIATVRSFVKQLTARGMCADWSLHDKGDGNPHAHIMTTMRSITEDGKWAAKSRLVYDLDENGERIFQKVNRQGRRQYKSHKEDYNDWNAAERVEEWRAAWAECCNARLEHRIDHRSYERQGKDLIPTRHEGYAARQRAAQGLSSERVQVNAEIRQRNTLLQRITAQLKALGEEIKQLMIRQADTPTQKPSEATKVPEQAKYTSEQDVAAKKSLQAQIEVLRGVPMPRSVHATDTKNGIYSGYFVAVDRARGIAYHKVCGEGKLMQPSQYLCPHKLSSLPESIKNALEKIMHSKIYTKIIYNNERANVKLIDLERQKER